MDAGTIKSLSKAEIHTHLEAFSPRTIEEFARDVGEDPPPPDYKPNGLDELLEHVEWCSSLVRTRSQAARIGREFAQRAGASGARYVDAILNPTHWGPWRARLGELLDGLASGFEEAEAQGNPRVNICLSILRSQSGDEAMDLVDWMADARHPRVVALSIDGNEQVVGRVSARFADAFARARELGFSLTAHAGESSGPEGVWDAIDVLGVDRVDHGFRAVSDLELVDTLAERRIPLGICPSANVALGWVSSVSEHPLERLRQAGVPISINTDSPWDFNLVDEYRLCAAAFQWDDDVIWQVARTSIEASFASILEKQTMLAEPDGAPGRRDPGP